MANPKRGRVTVATSADWALVPNWILPANEIGVNISTGEFRAGDGVTVWSELAAINFASSDTSALLAEVTALTARVTALENAEPPPPAEENIILRYADVSYHYPSTTGDWATLATNSAADKLAYIIANPDSGPGYEAKHEPGGSRHTLWTNAITPLTNTQRLFYVSTNYGDLQSTSSSARYRGTVGGNWRFKVTSANTISFYEYGTETLGGAVGSNRLMTFPAGAGPFAVKSWYSGGSGANGTTLPTGLALSTSYYLRPTGTTPVQTYTLHTSQAGAIANTGVVSITSGSGGGSGNGPFYIGWRRNLANVANVCAEMTRYVTLYGSLVAGWFFDECEVDDAAHDAWFDAIKTYRDANHPGLLLVMNGTPHSSARAALYDMFVMENNWSAFQGSRTLTLTGQPSDTQTVTLGAKTYTFQTTLTNTNGNVKIGATTAETISNLVAAVTLGAGSGTAYAAATTAHPTMYAYAGAGTTVIARALATGTAGNGLATTETMSNATWSGSSTTGGAEGVPSWVVDGTIPSTKVWAIVHDDVTVYDLPHVVDMCVLNKVGVVYINGPSAFGSLPTTGADGFSQDDVLAAIDAANVP